MKIALIIIIIFFIIPIPVYYKDGGSVGYKAVLYEIIKYHRLDMESDTGYKDGLEIKVFGKTVFSKK
ncbi:hypothetical protein H0R92_01290 [Treponema sp. OMZ 840]|uniref:hypothetical protein n=1 Tax=Treponema sp. OMZ 840 TaxID=244313 RepID=UPI003D8BDF09